MNSKRQRVPVILQQERGECGLACLAMIAGHFGKNVSVGALRQVARQSVHGIGLQELVNTAHSLQLIARPLRLSLEETNKLKLPAIIHWRMNHFVVLVAVESRRWTIHDPATGKRAVARNEFNESFTGVALEFTPTDGFITSQERTTISFFDIVGRFDKLYRYLGLTLLLLFVSQLLAIVPSIATQILVDEVVLGQDRNWLYRGLAALALIMAASIALDAVRGWISLYAGTRLATDSTVRVLSHLLSLPLEFIRRRHLGDILSKLESLTPIREALVNHCVNAIVQLVVLATTIVIMFLYSPWLAGVAVAGLAMSLAVTFSLLPASRRLSQQLLIHRASQNSSLVETLRAYDTVQSLGLSVVRRMHWQRAFSSAIDTTVRLGKISIGRSAAIGAINATEQLVFLGVGIAGILDREITLGVLFAFMGLRGRLGGAAIAITDLLQRLALLRVHCDRLFDIIQGVPVSDSPPGAARSRFLGDIRAAKLCFGYAADSNVIHSFNCHITPGSRVAITGPSGCGKTTLLLLLAGKLAPSSGKLMLDKLELELWDRHALASQVAVVLQNDQLFQETVAENIAGFSAIPDLARVRSAAVAAECWKDIQNLAIGVQTLIGAGGAGLSGGQIQRLTLARALYRQPAVLFLDEATSHLDVATEKRVLENIARLGLTIVSVAHRPNAIAMADTVISLPATDSG